MVVAAMVAAFSYNASRRRRRACTLTYRNTQAYPPRSAVLDCDMCAYNASRRRRRACTLTYRNTQAYPPRSAVLDCDMCALLLRH
jgi:hypothetical protein